MRPGQIHHPTRMHCSIRLPRPVGVRLACLPKRHCLIVGNKIAELVRPGDRALPAISPRHCGDRTETSHISVQITTHLPDTNKINKYTNFPLYHGTHHLIRSLYKCSLICTEIRGVSVHTHPNPRQCFAVPGVPGSRAKCLPLVKRLKLGLRT
jgi:hypothetical protein